MQKLLFALITICSLVCLCSGCGGSSSTITPPPPPAATYFAYAANQGSNKPGDNGSVITYSMNPNTGALTPIGTPLMLANTTSITVDPSNKYAYVTMIGQQPGVKAPGTVQAFTIDSASGALTAIGTPVVTGEYPTALYIDPNDNFAYVTALSGIWIYSIGNNGALTAVAGTPFNPTKRYSTATMSSTGFLYALDVSTASFIPYSVNNSTGALTASAGLAIDPTGVDVDMMAVDASGTHAYVNAFNSSSSSSSLSVYSINPTTGSLTSTGSSVISNGALMSLAPSGGYVYIANGDSVSAYSIDKTSGVVSADGSVLLSGASTSFWTIAVDPTNRYLYATNVDAQPGSLECFSIDSTTGALTLIPANQISTQGGYPYNVAFAKE